MCKQLLPGSRSRQLLGIILEQIRVAFLKPRPQAQLGMVPSLEASSAELPRGKCDGPNGSGATGLIPYDALFSMTWSNFDGSYSPSLLQPVLHYRCRRRVSALRLLRCCRCRFATVLWAKGNPGRVGLAKEAAAC